ncbi:hypothetical protein EWM64_g10734 [Hericium alpestre]|uniref:F-box domain-containing protein n=1 Tax=Hericium alpestre TaxID=135208 RepID=A0A4Y9ZIJ9_9AGAM|nr:hypothetical protein EWM64_g10734 [Hericium alpestre]
MVEGETKGLAEVIKLCDNLCEVRLNGWNSYELKDLIYAFKSKKRLQVLDINHKSLGSRKCGYFCYLPEFIKMLQGWPELRSVTVWMDTVGFDYSGFSYGVDEKAPRTITIVPGALPKLRHLDWRSGCLEQRHLAAISQIAPSLSEFQLKEGSMTVRQDLLESLQLCASRFTHFGLNFYDETLPGNDTKPSVDRHLDAAMSAMPRLRVLDTSSMYLRPAALSHGFIALTTLDYRITAEELDEFVSILSDPSAMPSLCELSLLDLSPHATKDEFSSALLENMHALCRSRGIKIRDQSYDETPDLGIVYHSCDC